MNSKKFFLLTLITLNLTTLHADQERITLFKSSITVNKDSSLDVVEEIKVRSKAQSIRRGLVREFPTRYKDRLGNNYNVGFKVKRVFLDGRPTHYKIENFSNGKRIYIGNPNKLLPSGYYTFTVHYRTARQLGFFENYDELYWNVTGNGWRLPIEKAQAFVTLPPDIPNNKISHEGYTGYQGSKGQHYTSKQNDNGKVTFESTRKFKEREGLTIVVTWPKGYVHQPTAFENFIHFVKDNFGLVLLIIILLALIIFYSTAWSRKRQDLANLTIIPRFHQPKNMSPGSVYYSMNMAHGSTSFAAEIIELARLGYIKIKHKKHWFSSSYTLIKNDNMNEAPEHKPMKELYETLFVYHNELEISQKNKKVTKLADDKLETYYVSHYQEQLFTTPTKLIWTATLTSLLAALPALWPVYASQAHIIPFFILIALIVGINMSAFYFLKTYTDQGKEIYAEIKGFKLFLETTETERLKMIGSPPTKTPELYERYLPYAIALGVEQQWSQQFAPIFEQMKNDGHAYCPVWYYGGPYRSFQPTSFSRNLSQSLGAAIASSVQKPGSSSGFGGGGSSGGGGGGGGGGGW